MKDGSSFLPELSRRPHFSWGDIVVCLTLLGAIAYGLHIAYEAPKVIRGPQLTLDLVHLPFYTALSLARMSAAYLLSLGFMFFYVYLVKQFRRSHIVLLPLLDILQSIPIFSFLPVALLSLSALLPLRVAVELASIILIFTSQVWNLTYAWYQALTNLPKELHEACTIFRFNRWLRFRTLELPFASISLTWNSMISWASGWFFLMAAEIFTVGSRDFRLPGLGAYLGEAASQGNLRALFSGLATLIFIIVAMDQMIWRPLLAWADKTKMGSLEGDTPTSSWFYNALLDSKLIKRIGEKWLTPIDDWLEQKFLSPQPEMANKPATLRRKMFVVLVLGFGVGLVIFMGAKAVQLLMAFSVHRWLEVIIALFISVLRVLASLILALLWTIPLGVAIGTNRHLARWTQPLVQILASIPATALFPALLLLFLKMPGGLNMAAIFLMLMGAQWYLLFNVIAGAQSIPQDLESTSQLLGLTRWERFKTLTFPVLFPYVMTGTLIASGGAWNVTVVAEYVQFGGETYKTLGIGSLIAEATAQGDYPLLFASTFSLIVLVYIFNQLLWRKLYLLVEEKYRLG